MDKLFFVIKLMRHKMLRSLKINWWVVALIILFSTNLFSQTDSLYTIVEKDTVTIYNLNAEGNCGSKFMMAFKMDEYHIKVMEIDTMKSEEMLECLCTYNLFIKIGPLNPGEYSVDVMNYRLLYRDSSFIGSLTFEISGDSVSNNVAGKLDENQSVCTHDIESMSDLESLPEDFNLSPVYPNPFNPETQIEFTIPAEGFVNVFVFDNNGQKIETLLEKELRKGNHQLIWDAGKFSSGVYFISVEFGNLKKTQKAILLK